MNDCFGEVISHFLVREKGFIEGFCAFYTCNDGFKVRMIEFIQAQQHFILKTIDFSNLVSAI